MTDSRNNCHYCVDRSCWACEITSQAIETGRWPCHSNGAPFPFVGWANLLWPIINALKDNTGQRNASAAIILQGEHDDEFTFMSSMPAGGTRKHALKMFIRAAQKQLEYLEATEND
jgi:hypothetical protein